MKYNIDLSGWEQVLDLTPAVYRSGPVHVRPGGSGSIVCNSQGTQIAEIPRRDRLNDDVRVANAELLAIDGKDDLQHVVCAPSDLIEIHLEMMRITKPADLAPPAQKKAKAKTKKEETKKEGETN